ncbi:hypothetical protein BS1321_00480 [Peribacillus simplex NBRC 15720 = DSM 1321]|uniref:Uncharacterized protein n=1 Tax=Peribacillus simplex NBRC 15720 = DSM 1321 TaxID=1349754 RepID=A0A223EBF9_9BACI|nr:hypothetical protein BS1321_00480 [Peribacillus simplex NBRC 15720 = DSM 1321]
MPQVLPSGYRSFSFSLSNLNQMDILSSISVPMLSAGSRDVTDAKDNRFATIEVCIKNIHQMNFQKKMYIYCKFFFQGMKKALLNGL